MLLGVLRETAPGEGRVAAVPSAVRALRSAGHRVLVEREAGAVSGFSDEEYIRGGAEIVPTAEEVYARAEVLWKVLRPEGHARSLLRPEHRLVCLVHHCLIEGGRVEGIEGGRGEQVWREALPCQTIAAEDFRSPETGTGAERPVLAAMSEIAGRLAVVAASSALGTPSGGRGLFLGGVPGVDPAEVVVLGAGVAGRSAATLAAAMGAAVTVMDTEVSRLRSFLLPGVRTVLSTAHTIERALGRADVVIAAVRGPDGRAPRLAGKGHLSLMAPGAVIVDLSILDGGAFETTPVTTLEAPAREVDGIIHIGVPNFPGAVPKTASVAFSQACLPGVLGVLGPA